MSAKCQEQTSAIESLPKKWDRQRHPVVQAADKVSEILVNTRSVARSSYIHPSVIKAYESGKLEASLFRGRMRKPNIAKIQC